MKIRLLLEEKFFDLICFFFSLFLLGCAAYLEYIVGLVPCPLCIIQRSMVFLLGLLFLLGYLFPFSKAKYRIWHFITFIVAVLGALTAAWQLWITRLPNSTVSCSASLDYIIKILPFKEFINYIFQHASHCGYLNWQLLGLSIPSWTLLCFMFFIIVAVCKICQR